MASKLGAEVSDTLKYFSERIPATFVYAGIDVERALLAGTRGDQIRGRFSMLETAPLVRDEEWRGLIAALESSLRLHHHRAGTLVELDEYLFTRTTGKIGSLFRLIRIAGVDAVLNGTEAITKTSLQDINLDITAEDRT